MPTRNHTIPGKRTGARLRLRSVCPALLLLLTACTSTPPTDQDIHSAGTLKQFFAKPHDPRRFGLTVYQSTYGPLFSGSKRLHNFQTAQADYLGWSAYLPKVEVRSRKLEVVDALLDTGSRDSWLTLDAALRLAAQPLGPPPYRRTPDHVTETEPGVAVYISTLRIKDLHIENMVAYVRVPQITLGPLARRAEPQPEMVLGCDLLREFAFVRFDYPAKRVYFSSDRKYETVPELVIESVPYRKLQGTLAVDAVFDGQPVRAIVDTGGDFEVAWNQPGETIRQLSMGDLVLLDVQVSPPAEHALNHPEIPRIGSRLLRKFAITLDNKQRCFVFERPSDSASPFEPSERKKPTAADYEAYLPQ